jgi:MGT family glycosyltransferase
MSKVLFLGMPSHGHVNPTLGLVSELVKQGEQVVYFAAEPFREKIEAAGATFKAYNRDLDIFTPKNGRAPGTGLVTTMLAVVEDAPEIIADILKQVEGIRFDYLIHSAAFVFAGPIIQILGIPAVSSLAVFAGLRSFSAARFNKLPGAEILVQRYRAVSAQLAKTYHITMPEDVIGLLMNKAELNLVYTSKYFAPDPEFFDETYRFVGPPVYPRKEDLDFPFEKLQDQKVLYISMGTVFGTFDLSLYQLFFESFTDWPGIVVMAAHKVDLSAMTIPANFIVRDYVPQSALLTYTTAAITHAGMNSISDLISAEVPFVCIPLGADQPLLAKRAEELGATIALDAKALNPETLTSAVNKVLDDPAYQLNMKTIAQSFRGAGGYPTAVEAIFAFKKDQAIK